MIPKVSCIFVCLNNRFKTTFGFASFFNSITILIPSLSDSSLKSEIPTIFLSLTKSAMLSISLALLTWYGISVTIILCLPFSSSISVLDLTTIFPFPVSYAALIPDLPIIIPPVGKSGPFIHVIISNPVASGLSINIIVPSITSPKLWGGIFVAIPTAIPEDPLTKRFGYLEGNTTGSCSSPSKFGMKSTVFLLISLSISIAILFILASVYLIAAALSPSTEPKLPWPSTSIYLIEKSWAILTNAS